MLLNIDETACIGCGLCEEMIPELVEMGKFTARVKKRRVPSELEDEVLATVKDCPADALSVEQGNSEAE